MQSTGKRNSSSSSASSTSSCDGRKGLLQEALSHDFAISKPTSCRANWEEKTVPVCSRRRCNDVNLANDDETHFSKKCMNLVAVQLAAKIDKLIKYKENLTNAIPIKDESENGIKLLNSSRRRLTTDAVKVEKLLVQKRPCIKRRRVKDSSECFTDSSDEEEKLMSGIEAELSVFVGSPGNDVEGALDASSRDVCRDGVVGNDFAPLAKNIVKSAKNFVKKCENLTPVTSAISPQLCNHLKRNCTSKFAQKVALRRSASWDDLQASNRKLADGFLNVWRADGSGGSQSPSELSLYSSSTLTSPCGLFLAQNSAAVSSGGGGGASTKRKNSLTVGSCEMCANYEFKLQQLQDNEKRLRQQLSAVQSSWDSCKSELSTERSLRLENERRFAEVQSSLGLAVDDLRLSLSEMSLEIERQRSAHEQDVAGEVERVSRDKAEVERNLKILQQSHDRLLGRHRARSNDMTNATINLPQSVDELQERCLNLGEQLIEAKIACEHLEEKLKDELAITREEVSNEREMRERMEATLSDEINSLRTDLAIAKSRLYENENLRKSCEEKDRCIEQHRVNIADLENALADQKKDNSRLETACLENRQRAQILHQELDNSEQVQQDFVRLSQSLQIELEKIRQSDNEVRWQHEEDVLLCNGCGAAFTKTRRKANCKHCGKIFCEKCLDKVVPSGPQKRPSLVCNVCHTLLMRDTAPYFSTHVPSTVRTAESASSTS